MADPLLSLPVVSGMPDEGPDLGWHGLTAVGPVLTLPLAESAATSPEPDAPQGEYSCEVPASLLSETLLEVTPSARPIELLAPAGGPDAAYAALHYGA